MPIYEYICTACGHRFETLVRGDGDVPEECPECGSKKIKKQFASFSASSSSGSSAGPSCSTGTCPFA